MPEICKIFLIFLAATAVSGCITLKNPFQSPDAGVRTAPRAASGAEEDRGARARTGVGQDERALLRRALKALAQTRRLGRAAALNRTPGTRVVFDYVYFDHDLQEMIKAVREYLTARDSGARTARTARTTRTARAAHEAHEAHEAHGAQAVPPLKLDYAR